MNRLKDKVAIITGGSGGIGSTTAKKFIEEGAKVMLVDIDEEALEKTAEEIGSDRLGIHKADVSNEEEVKEYVQKCIDEFGGIDIFFDNAGIEGDVAPLEEYPLDKFRKLMDINVMGAYYGLRYVFPHMKEKGGSIIISSSVAGLQGTANVLPYVTSKHALVGMMKSAALEGASHKIRVNCINPSPVDNRMMRSLENGFSPDDSNEAKSKFEQMIPMGRYAENEDVAYLVLFLASDESRFITGTVNPADGGMTA